MRINSIKKPRDLRKKTTNRISSKGVLANKSSRKMTDNNTMNSGSLAPSAEMEARSRRLLSEEYVQK